MVSDLKYQFYEMVVVITVGRYCFERDLFGYIGDCYTYTFVPSKVLPM